MTRLLARTLLGGMFASLVVLPWNATAFSQDWQADFAQGDALYKARKYDSAIVFWEARLDAVRADADAHDTLTPIILFKLANNHSMAARYDTALSLFDSAITTGKDAWNPVGVAFSNIHNSRGITLMKLGRYPEAEVAFLEALEIRKSVLGPDAPLIASSLNNLSIAYRNQRRYAEAERALSRSLAIRIQAFGPDDRRLASTYQNLGNVKAATGRYGEAEAMYRKALELKEAARGTTHPSLASSLNGLALAYTKQGRWADAEPLYHRSIQIIEDGLGADHPAITEPLQNLAILYFNLGKFAEAEALDRRVLAIRQARLGPDHPQVAAIMSNLAHRLWVQGKTDEAMSLLRQALAVQQEHYGSRSSYTLNTHVLFAKFFASNHRYDSALAHFRIARSITHDTAGYEAAVLAELHEGMGRCLTQQGELILAASYYDSAMTLMSELPRLVQARMTNVFESRSLLYRMMGEPEKAANMALMGLKLRQSSFSENALVLSERDALTFSQRVRWAGGYYFSALLDREDPSNLQAFMGAEAILSTKGQVSDEIFTRLRGITVESDSTVRALAAEFRAVRFEIASRFVSGQGSLQDGESQAELDSLQGLAANLEEQLARSSASFRRTQAQAPQLVSQDLVRLALPGNTVLVEYLSFDYHTPVEDRIEPRYLALVLKVTGSPVVIDLGPAAPIHALVEEYRSHFLALSEHPGSIGQRDDQAYKQLSQSLYDLLWRPVSEHVPSRADLFVSPDLALNLVSFAGLTDPSGRFLMEEHAIHYLSAGRDLAKQFDSTSTATGLYVLGDPDFDCAPELRLASAGSHAVESPDASISYALRGTSSDCEAFLAHRVPPLPGARTEVERVSSLWGDATSNPAVVRTGAAASEELFKVEAGNHQIIHLATHGYFVQSECASEQLDASGTFFGENPLLLSGLFLAGANLRGNTAHYVESEDGVLTAEEVAGMNFEDTRLVVLSACETGLGEVRQGEGVYGLRRAFQMSGVSTVVSALWRVPDQETAKFMTRLYTSQSETYPDLMRDAALSQLNELRQRGRSDHPFNWAGFVASGDWRMYR